MQAYFQTLTIITVSYTHLDVYKRQNLYVAGPVALNVDQRFSVRRLCAKDGKHNLANQFVGKLMEQLVQKGRLVTAETRNGPGIRTATDAEIRSPLPGQQQMTL